jgi:putative transposase
VRLLKPLNTLNPLFEVDLRGGSIIFGKLLSITARKVFERFPKIRRTELWGGQFWSDGKYIGTVGEATSEKTIRNYIKNQSMDKKQVEPRMKQLKLFKL